MLLAATTARLSEVTQWLEGREYLEDRFTAADLLMTTVLRTLRHSNLVTKNSTLHAYQHRCEARPAFQKALKDHMASFVANAPA
jgi:glutathione S-transferase